MSEKNYSLTSTAGSVTQAPDLPYKPRLPKSWKPKIGMIACGGITAMHVDAYKRAGLEMAAFCDLEISRAEERRAEGNPSAVVTTDYREVLDRKDIEVVDIACHPPERAPLIRDAILAGKHVLSQKPFVLNLDEGEALVKLAQDKGVQLAVNQNGRWSPHWSWMREAVKKGLIGDILGAHYRVHWSHDWVAGTPFDEVPQVILYDFAIHWFDSLTMMMGDREPLSVYATETCAQGQTAKPPLLSQALVSFEGAQASLVFDAFARHGSRDCTILTGTMGTLESVGPDLGSQTLTFSSAGQVSSPVPEGAWFSDGFMGTMGELLCAIEEGREPQNSAKGNLRSLALCFAALKSARTGRPETPGKVRSVSE
jgi:predicted dehydrogenase